MLKGTVREVAAEFLGTFILLVFGAGVVAQVVLSGHQNGDYLSINLAWGLAVTMAIYVAGGVSGAHLNPAITLTAALFRDFSWKKVIPYIVAQFAGAFAGAAAVYFTYREAFDNFDNGVREITGPHATAGIFATYPQSFLSLSGGVIDQVVGTALLVILVFALTDRRNNAPEEKTAPILIGAAVVLIGMTFGFNAGYAINPARDLGPRLFTAIAGWGNGVFAAGNQWWWVPVVAPCFGGILGGLIYDLLITRNHPVSVAIAATKTAEPPAFAPARTIEARMAAKLTEWDTFAISSASMPPAFEEQIWPDV
jgi:MIP family channel proteins